MSEARTLRDRQAAARRDMDSAASDAGQHASAAVVCQTISLGSYPTAAKVYYAAVPVDVGGAEVEGGQATFTRQTGTVFVLNEGGTAIPEGTTILAHLVGNRYVCRYG